MISNYAVTGMSAFSENVQHELWGLDGKFHCLAETCWAPLKHSQMFLFREKPGILFKFHFILQFWWHPHWCTEWMWPFYKATFKQKSLIQIQSNHLNFTDVYEVKERSSKREVQTALKPYRHLLNIPSGSLSFFLSAEEQPFDESIDGYCKTSAMHKAAGVPNPNGLISHFVNVTWQLRG